MKAVSLFVVVAVPLVALWFLVSGAFVGDIRVCPFWKAFRLGSQPFSAVVWKNDVTKRSAMLRSLASSTRLIGQTPEQIAELIGEGFDCYVIQDGYPCYAVPLGGSSTNLAFFMDDGTISGVTLSRDSTPLLGCLF